jgi:hypothetical protein
LKPEVEDNVVLDFQPAAPAGMLVISKGEQDEAQRELETEYELRGDKFPDHVAKTEAFTACTRCTLVARRALAIALARADGQSH